MNQVYSTHTLTSPAPTVKWTALAITMLLLVSGDSFSQKNNGLESETNSATVQSFLPGTLINWNVKIDNDKVFLTWTTTIEKNSLHFKVEKSINGIEYTDAGVVSAAGNSSIRKNYAFTEKLGTKTNKLVYYRLKMIDLDSTIRLSDVRTIRGIQLNSVALQLYPNPAVNQLILSIPGEWANQNLQIQVFNMNGLMVRSKVNEKGQETETVDVKDLVKGMYFVKLSNGTESSLQKFLKN